MFTIEEAKPDQREAALAITVSAYGEYEKSSTPDFWIAYRENIRRTVLEDRSAVIILASDESSIKGSVVFCPSTAGGVFANGLPEMRLLAVPPEHRNLGIARLLVEECERRAADGGVLTLHTTSLMTTAREMYERHGYVRFPEIDFEPVPGFIVWGYKKILHQHSLATKERTK